MAHVNCNKVYSAEGLVAGLAVIIIPAQTGGAAHMRNTNTART